jgi:hypothetical protein
MARIRSIHPGFWTDEAVVSVSRDARLFLVGIWNQCDDKGVFEWKPVVLRMRIFPADLIEVVNLLAELENADLIRPFEADGRRYGAVRNFVIFQRPKRPNNVYPLLETLWDFTGLTPDGSPQVRNKGVNRSTDGGGRRENPPKTPPISRRGPKGAGWSVIANEEVQH